MAIDPVSLGLTFVGGLMQSSAADSAASAQRAADAARLAEEKRVREQLRVDTEAQRAVADQAFADYNAGLISYAEAQQRAGEAMQQMKSTIGESQLSDTQKAMEMAQFQPYSIRTGTGRTFVDEATGQAGFALSPETYGYQQDLYRKAGEAAGNIATSPEAAAQQYMAQQQGLLAPQRQQQDLAMRANQLKSGRIGLGIASEAAGAGAGGMVNPDQFRVDRARALADAQIAADAMKFGQDQQAKQLDLAKGLFGAGMAPEDLGLRQLQAGLQYGQTAANAGVQQANLYAGGMEDYYRSMLSSAQTAVDNAQYVPKANLTAAQEQYQRQQTALNNLSGNTLNYQAIQQPDAIIPGSAYTMGMFGNQLVDYGMTGIRNSLYPGT